MEGIIHNEEWTTANRRFYALARKCHMSSDDIHATIYRNFKGKSHTDELTPEQLNSLSDGIQKHALSRHARIMDTLRKRVMGAVRRYCRAMGYSEEQKYVIDIIERGGKEFNKMTEVELNRKYNTFNKLANELNAERDQTAEDRTEGKAKRILIPNNQSV